jgi:hypothetical protein
MIDNAPQRGTRVVPVINILLVGEAITFLLAALWHLGIPIVPGFVPQPIIYATIVEGLCWLFLSWSFFALRTNRSRAWGITLAAHIFAILAVLLGIYATSQGPGNDVINYFYHRGILVVLVINLILLLTPGARSVLRHRNRSL